jgi:hypothetical protein
MPEPKARSDPPPETPPARRTCGTLPVHERLLRTVPGYRQARDASENYAWRAMLMPFAARTGCTKISVVVHVVYKTAAQSISDAQIKSQIDVLNADFRKKNADIGAVPAAFQPAAADARIQFELAATDPDGNPTPGILRVKTTKDAFVDDDGVKAAATGGSDAWPADKYLNIWVCQLGNNLLGYAQFPGGPAATDGVVILYTAFGTVGTAAAPFNLGRTCTHEVGHWLNLRHIWGDDGTGCSGDDFVTDTPNQAGPNYGTPAWPSVSCGNAPNGDMFMNYMDYVDDAAMMMFTGGQVTRMQATLDSTRSSIGTTTPCGKSLPSKELPKEFPKELPKEFPKELPKDFPKDPPKDFPKDPPKEFPKDPPKDFPKDPPKEFHKEFAKDFPADLPKGVFDPKSLFEPPQKGVFDPPKGFFEPPVELPFGGGPFGPAGGVPFVLGTGAGVGGGGASPFLRQQTATLAHEYGQLLAQFARLHARGMLDPQGLAAWQEAAAALQRVIGMGG